MNTNSLRKQIPAAGSFSSVPGAFATAPEEFKQVVKMEFTTEEAGDSGGKFGSQGLQLETVFSTDWFMLDLGAADVSAIEPEKIIKDCELVTKSMRDNPAEVKKMIAAFRPSSPISDIDDAIKVGESIGLTEENAVASGGDCLGSW